MIPLDTWLYTWIVTHRWAPLDPVMTIVSVSGRAFLVWAVLAIVAFWRKRISGAALFRVALVLILSTVVHEQVLKPIVHRPRPFVALPGVAPLLDARPASSSFPSGHAADSVAGALALSSAWPAARAWLFALAALVSFSRVYVGVHYPLDVIGGAIVGLIVAALVTGGCRADLQVDGSDEPSGPSPAR